MPLSTILPYIVVVSLLVEETGEKHWPVTCHWQTCFIEYTSPWAANILGIQNVS